MVRLDLQRDWQRSYRFAWFSLEHNPTGNWLWHQGHLQLLNTFPGESRKKKQPNLEILPHDMNMQGLDTSSVITNVAANYRACHDTVIHEYSSLTETEAEPYRGLYPHFTVSLWMVNRYLHHSMRGAFQLEDKLFHKASLVNSMLYKGVLKWWSAPWL